MVTHSIQIIAGGELTDTVQASVPQALVVQIPGATAGTQVVFQPKQTFPRGTERGMLVCPVQIGSCGIAIGTVADSAGRASVRIAFGTIAGSTWIYVSANDLHVVDSVHYTVLPVAPAGFGFAVRDSSAYVGAGYSAGAHLVDHFGNTASGSFTATALGNAATVSSNGVFTAQQIGRSGALFRSGAVTDTAWITVPPRGTIASYDAGVNGPEGIATFNLDGSGLHFRVAAGNPDYGQIVDWLPNGDIVYSGVNERLYTVDAAGNTHKVSGPASPANYEAFADAGSDGSVIYTAWGPGDSHSSVWRVPTVGGTPAPMPLAVLSTNTWMAALSADTKRVVYVGNGVQVADAATGSLQQSLAPTGAMPRWSPTGDRVVFNADTTLYMVNADGSLRHSFGPQHYYYPRADWSPDGTWVIARTRNRLELINTGTGEFLQMPPWTLSYLYPAWKR